jgi:hypothetical protein
MKGLCITVLVSIVTATLWLGPSFGVEQAKTRREGSTSAASERRRTEPSVSAQKVAYRLDFSDYGGGPVEEWLKAKGFKFEEAAKDQNLLGIFIHDGALILQAKEQIRGFLFNDSLHVEKFSKVRIAWGIMKYPEGASYERQVRNEALMFYISFGDEKISSGNIVLPNLPYFIGLFLCKDDKIGTPYIGKHYQEGGRFVCLGHPPPNQTILSEFDLVPAFQAYFGKAEVPPISGINFGVDTSDAGDGGKAAAYIKKIEILE